jgi:hypothetical protein
MSEVFNFNRGGFRIQFLSAGMGPEGITDSFKLTNYDEEFQYSVTTFKDPARGLSKEEARKRMRDLVGVMRDFVKSYEEDFGAV